MTLARVPEMLEFYGPDTMLLIGGSLLGARAAGRGVREFPRAVIAMVRPHDKSTPPFRPPLEDFRWDEWRSCPTRKTARAPFKDISRQVLFEEAELRCELRYFEMEPGGYSTLERHEHTHAVMILRGHGQCMVGGEVRAVKQFDLVSIPALTWHQFRATATSRSASCAWSKSARQAAAADEEDLAAMKAGPAIAEFLKD